MIQIRFFCSVIAAMIPPCDVRCIQKRIHQFNSITTENVVVRPLSVPLGTLIQPVPSSKPFIWSDCRDFQFTSRPNRSCSITKCSSSGYKKKECNDEASPKASRYSGEIKVGPEPF